MRYDTDYTPDEKDHVRVPEGDYPFTVVGATEKISKNDNDMLEMELAVDVGRQSDMTVYDKLVMTKSCGWKIHQFCHGIGLDFSGEIDAQMVMGRSGRARFGDGEPREGGKSDGKRFLEVKWYIAADKPAGSPKALPEKAPAMPKTSRVTAPPVAGYLPPAGNDPPPHFYDPPPHGDEIPF